MNEIILCGDVKAARPLVCRRCRGVTLSDYTRVTLSFDVGPFTQKAIAEILSTATYTQPVGWVSYYGKACTEYECPRCAGAEPRR